MATTPILTLESAEQLLDVLAEYLDKCEANYALVIDRGGIIFSQHGTIPADADPNIIAALAAGSFAATYELALRVGESDCTALYQQGSQSHILISAVDTDVVLVTVFDTSTTVGLVKFYSTRILKQISEVLLQASQAPRPAGPFTTADLAEADQVF
ncbi:roadblock/LC7 domain-containing protein [bacterium]|nr:roadblock/LC7 domain-containing protein [bacterium]